MLKITTTIPFILLIIGVMGCNSSDKDEVDTIEEPVAEVPDLQAGAASQSLLPTVNGSRDYLADAPGWPEASLVDPNNPGVFIDAWDQGVIDVGNGEADASWVHDDIRVTSLALSLNDEKVILVSTDTYMHLSPDVDKIVEDARAALPAEWSEVDILIHATHNHHGPGTAFSINRDWYQMASEQIVLSITQAVENMEPATATIASGMHGYGAYDQRDPRITDDRLNVMTFNSYEDNSRIATMVQWASHPETTLGFDPDPASVSCPETEEDCNAEDRYFTADFVGVLQQRLKESDGGEVLYLNGAIGVLIATLHAPVWKVTEEHPVGNGHDVPEGAEKLLDSCNDYECKNFLKTESVGNELYKAVASLIEEAEPYDFTEISVMTADYFTRMSNYGFSYLAANNALGWQSRTSYTCEIPFSVENCIDNGDATDADPVFGSVLKGDVTKTRFTRVDFGDVGMMYMPGEVPPELVIGLPDDFLSDTGLYYLEPEYHAVGDDYVIPGYLLSLPDEQVTFTVGLGTDQLGYHVPMSDFRVFCPDNIMAALGAPSCADLYSYGAIEGENWVSGARCKALTEGDETTIGALGELAPVVGAACRYGQAIDRAPGHYHETNSLGWDLVDDMWEAAKSLYQ